MDRDSAFLQKKYKNLVIFVAWTETVHSYKKKYKNLVIFVTWTETVHSYKIKHKNLVIFVAWTETVHSQTFREKKINMQDIGPAPNNFLQDLLKLCRTGIYKF